MTQDPGPHADHVDGDDIEAGGPDDADVGYRDAGEVDVEAGGPDSVDVGDGTDLVDEAELDAIEATLADVGSALDRLADGTYGACEICGRTVADDVLAADPTARRCPEHLPLVATGGAVPESPGAPGG